MIQQSEYELKNNLHRRREQGRTEDALASEDDEGRGKLRKAAGICKQELIRGHPNGGTWQAEGLPLARAQTQKTETS